MAKALATHRVTRHGWTSDRPPLSSGTNTPSASPARPRQEPSRGARCQSRERLGDGEVGGHGWRHTGPTGLCCHFGVPSNTTGAAECLIKDREALLGAVSHPAYEKPFVAPQRCHAHD